MTGEPLLRRNLLLGAATLVVGVDLLTGGWVTAAEAADGIDATPPLEGTLHVDPETRAAAAEDLGHVVRRVPAAVLRPKSARDIAAMVRFCRKRGVAVAPRGQHHTTHGQGLTNGLIVEMGSLAAVHEISQDRVEVDAGIMWRELLDATLPHGLTVPVLTSYLGLSVGGTLSVGGLGTTPGGGLQVDHVRELEVVDGRGEVRRCSLTRDRELFEAALGGLGQCAIITRAVLELVPAPSMVRSWVLTRAEPRSLLRDFRTLLDRGEVTDVWCELRPPGMVANYGLRAAIPFEPGREPDDARLLRGLSTPAVTAVPRDRSYRDYVRRVDLEIETLRLAGWDGLIKPWFDVWLPDDAVERYLTEVVPSLTVADVGPGLCLLSALRRSALTRPSVRVPEQGRYLWLFDILGASARPGPDVGFVRAMLARNRRLFDKAAALGGFRYPIGSLEFTTTDWLRHYGVRWPDLQRLKSHHDPDGILTPGPGIFG